MGPFSSRAEIIFVWSNCVLLVHVFATIRCSYLLPQYKDIHIRQVLMCIPTDDSAGVSVIYCLPLSVGFVMFWPLVQSVTPISFHPKSAGTGSNTLTTKRTGDRKLMAGNHLEKLENLGRIQGTVAWSIILIDSYQLPAKAWHQKHKQTKNKLKR